MKQNLGELAVPSEAPVFSDARAVLENWINAVVSGQVENVLPLYAEDAVLVPTLSNEIQVTEAGRRNYFEFFLSRNVLSCAIDQEVVRMEPKRGTVAIGGLYTFTFRTDDGGREAVSARFLFIFEELDGRWLITGHHSSRCV